MERVLFVNPKSERDIRVLNGMLKDGWHVISQEGVAQNVAVWGMNQRINGRYSDIDSFAPGNIIPTYGEVIFSFVLEKNEQTSEDE